MLRSHPTAINNEHNDSGCQWLFLTYKQVMLAKKMPLDLEPPTVRYQFNSWKISSLSGFKDKKIYRRG